VAAALHVAAEGEGIWIDAAQVVLCTLMFHNEEQ